MAALKNQSGRVLVTHPEFPKEALDILSNVCEVIICKSVPPNRNEILEKIPGVHGIFWTKNVYLDAEILNAAGPQLKVVAIMTSGTDYVDVEELKRRNIHLGHTREAVNNAVADLAMGLMIAAARRFHEGRKIIENSTWVNYHMNWMWGKDIRDSVIGFFGFGGIAKTITKRLSGFDVKEILYNTRRPESTEVEKKLNVKHATFDKLLEKSDFIFIAAPLTTQTAGIFDARAFKKMKNTAVIVNIGRGKLINQPDLIQALRTQEIFAAGLDVMTPEPLPKNHPLLDLPNCVLVPHIGTATKRTKTDMAILTAQNIINGVNGNPLITPAF